MARAVIKIAYIHWLGKLSAIDDIVKTKKLKRLNLTIEPFFAINLLVSGARQ